MLPLRCLFAFHGATGCLLEIKRQDLPAQFRRFAQGEPDSWQASVSAWLTAAA